MSNNKNQKATKTSIWALILGIASLFLSAFAGIPALILGIIGLAKKLPKKGFCIFGVVCGILTIICWIVITIFLANGININDYSPL